MINSLNFFVLSIRISSEIFLKFYESENITLKKVFFVFSAKIISSTWAGQNVFGKPVDVFLKAINLIFDSLKITF